VPDAVPAITVLSPSIIVFIGTAFATAFVVYKYGCRVYGKTPGRIVGYGKRIYGTVCRRCNRAGCICCGKAPAAGDHA